MRSVCKYMVYNHCSYSCQGLHVIFIKKCSACMPDCPATFSCGSCQASLPCRAPGLRPWPVLRECQPAYGYPARDPSLATASMCHNTGASCFQGKPKLTLASAPACSPHAFITKASLTDTQAMTWAPASVSLAKSFTYPGRCVFFCRHISENCQP